MKQNITIDQLKELTEIQHEELRLWYLANQHEAAILVNLKELQSKNPKIDPVRFVERDTPMREEYTKHWIPLLSIGQMIEFLEEYREWWTIKQEYVQGENEDGMILDHNRWNVFRENTSNPFYSERQLCDALWEAVKEVLEQQA